ncbi:MAG: hypothetical protein CVV00_00340 [Firmicutes bacterium HGW-Firmicutes-5]|nr:MAG: hypothetical protein CVV00_00340 [Firmicutes bacterium HGW-Firmicutes-5]
MKIIKNCIWILMLILLVGCGKDEGSTEKAVTEGSSQETVNVEDKVAENVEESVAENTEVNEEEVDSSEVKGSGKITYDATLTGEDLIKSIKFEGDSDFFHEFAFKSTSETKMDTGSGIQTTMIELVHNENGDLYMKSTSPMGVGITLSKEIDGIEKTYSYMEGETTGYITEDSMDEDMYDDAFEDDFGLYDPEYETILEAKVEKLDGKEVIYYVLEGEEGLVKNWFSPEIGGPVKTEVWVGDLLVMESRLTSYEALSKVDDKYFEVPSDITFQEIEY